MSVDPAANLTTDPPGRWRRMLRALTVPQRFLALLLVIFLFKGIIISLVFPPYTGHDEVTHYAYLKVLADEGRVPLIPDPDHFDEQYRLDDEYDDWDMIPDEFYPYGRYVTADWWYEERYENDPIRAVTYEGRYLPSGWVYTGNHPPLFYTLLLPVYWLVEGMSIESQIYFIRMATIPFGMATVLLAYLTVRQIFPRDRFLAMTVPAFVAFQPQISYESAMLNNDILAIMFSSAVIWQLAVGLRKRFPLWNVLLIGVFFGLAMLSKSTSAAFVVPIAFAMFFGIGPRHWKAWISKGAVAAVTAGVLVWPWLAYMWWTYGDLTALNRVGELQWWNYGGGDGRSIWSMLSDKWFFWDRWKETWGAFGWRLIQLDTRDPTLLRVLLWIAFFATAGLAIYALRFLRAQREIDAAEARGADPAPLRAHGDETLTIMPSQVVGVLTMGVACVLGYYSILQFGTTFSLTQARYYFPMIVPGAVLFMLGVRAWFPRQALPVVAGATFLGLVVLNLIIYTAYVIPYWNQGV